MKERILEQCSLGMKAYSNAESVLELAVASDVMANAFEEIIRVLPKDVSKTARRC